MQQGPFAPRALPRFNATTDPAATVSSSTVFPGPPVMRSTLLRRFLDGTRTASPVAWHVLTFSASLIHTPTMQEFASVRRFLDGLCSGSNDDSASAAPLLRLIRRVDISPGSVSILLDRNTCAACLSQGEVDPIF